MKFFFKELETFIVSLYHFFRWIFSRLYNVGLYRCKKGCTKISTIKILGNGSSLSHFVENFNYSGKCDFCCVNSSLLSEFYSHIKPKYHLFIDPVFYYRSYLDDNGLSKRIKDIDWDIVFIVPYKRIKFMKERYQQNQHISYIGYPGGLPLEMGITRLRHYLFKNGLASPPAQNVIVAAIYHMIMEGYKTIELYGVEHSWLHQMVVNDNNELCLVDSHFYDKEKAKMFVWKSDFTGIPFKVHEILGYLKITFEAYHDLNLFTKYLGGIKIYNCTPNSFIDAFDRKYDTKDSI